MKRKYYKFTDAYCRHLEALTCMPVRFKLPKTGGAHRLNSASVQSDDLPCNGQRLSRKDYPGLFDALKKI